MSLTRALRLAARIVVTGALLGITGSIAAQPSTSLPPAAEQALRRGLVAAQQEDWALAIRYFEQARKAAPQVPEILFNLGLAESKASGRELRAIAWLKAYLTVHPAAPNAKQVRDLLDVLEVKTEGIVGKLLQQGKQLATQMPGDYERKSAIARVAVAQARTGDLSGAKQTAATLPPDSDSAFGDVARALAEAGDVDSAKSLVWNIKSDVYKSSAYQDIAIVQANAGDITGAQLTLNSATRNDYKSSALIAIARAQFKAGRRDEAYATLAQARDLITRSEGSFKTSSYHDVGQAQAQLGDINGALQTAATIADPKYGEQNKKWIYDEIARTYKNRFDERMKAGDLEAARQLAAAIPDPDKKSDAYEELAEHRIQARDYEQAARLIEQIADSSSGKALRYAKLATALLEAGETRKARQVLARAQGKLAAMNPLFFNNLADAQIEVGDLDAARQILPLIKDESSRSDALQSYAVALAKAGNVAEAKQMAAGIKDYRQKWTLEKIAKIQLGSGDVAGALDTVGLIREAKERSSPYAEIVEQQVKTADVAGALQTASLITETIYKSWAYRSIAQHQLRSGDPKGRQTVALIPDAATKDGVYAGVTEQQASRKDFAGAKDTANLIAEEGRKLPAYLSIASHQLNAGYRRAAGQTVSQARDMAERIQDPATQAAGYAGVAGHLLGLGDVPGARRAVELAKTAASKVTDPKRRVELYATDYASVLGWERTLGMWSAARESLWLALESAPLLGAGYVKSWAYESLARRHRQLGDLVGAKEIAARLTEKGAREKVLAAVAGDEVGEGNLKFAREVLGELKEKEVQDSVYLAIARWYAEKGKLAEANQAVAQIGEGSRRKSAFQAVAIAAAKAGDLNAAKAAAAQIQEEPDSSLLGAFVKAGDINWALQALARVKREPTRDAVYAAIAEAQAKAGDLKAARKTLAQIGGDVARHQICHALADAGDTSGAIECAGRLKEESLRFSVLLAIARAQGKRGDKPGALQTLGRLKGERRTIQEMSNIAAVHLAIGDVPGALDTLALVHPKDPEFESWANYQFARYTLYDPSAVKQYALAIKDDYWRSRTLREIAVFYEKDQSRARELAAAIPDVFQKSLAYLGLARRALKDGNVPEAREFADLVPEDGYKLLALAETTLGAVARNGLRDVATRLASLPDGPGKAYLFTDLASLHLARGDIVGSLALLATAQKTVGAITAEFWKARAYAEIGRLASQANAPKVAEGAMQLASTAAGRLGQPEKQRWADYLSRQTAARELERAKAEDEKAKADERRKKTAEKWASFVDNELSKPQYTDLQAYIQSLTGKEKAKDILDGIVNTAEEITRTVKRIKAVEAEK